MRTKKTTRKPATKPIHHSNKLISRRILSDTDRKLLRLYREHEKFMKMSRHKAKPIKSMSGRVSRPLVSMPYFVSDKPVQTNQISDSIRFSSKTKSVKTAEGVFNQFKDAWNDYVKACSDAARDFVSLPNNITVVAAADAIKTMQLAYDNARKSAVNLFIEISKLPVKKQLEWVKKSLGLEMIQVLKLTSEKVVMQTYINCKNFITKS